MNVARRVPTPVWPVIRRTLDARHRGLAIQDLRRPAGTRVEAGQGDRIGGSLGRGHEPARITCPVKRGAVDTVPGEDDPAGAAGWAGSDAAADGALGEAARGGSPAGDPHTRRGGPAHATPAAPREGRPPLAAADHGGSRTPARPGVHDVSGPVAAGRSSRLSSRPPHRQREALLRGPGPLAEQIFLARHARRPASPQEAGVSLGAVDRECSSSCLNEEPPRSTMGRRALARAPRKLMAGAWRGGSRGAAGRAPTQAPAPSVRRNGPYTLGVGRRGHSQTALRHPAAPAAGVGLHGSRADLPPRAGPRPVSQRNQVGAKRHQNRNPT